MAQPERFMFFKLAIVLCLGSIGQVASQWDRITRGEGGGGADPASRGGPYDRITRGEGGGGADPASRGGPYDRITRGGNPGAMTPPDYQEMGEGKGGGGADPKADDCRLKSDKIKKLIQHYKDLYKDYSYFFDKTDEYKSKLWHCEKGKGAGPQHCTSCRKIPVF